MRDIPISRPREIPHSLLHTTPRQGLQLGLPPNPCSAWIWYGTFPGYGTVSTEMAKIVQNGVQVPCTFTRDRFLPLDCMRSFNAAAQATDSLELIGWYGRCPENHT